MPSFSPTGASRAVLIEVLNVLGAFRDRIVLVGGWVPDLLYPDRGHMGSLDVDLAVSRSAFGENVYQSKRMLTTSLLFCGTTGPTSSRWPFGCNRCCLAVLRGRVTRSSKRSLPRWKPSGPLGRRKLPKSKARITNNGAAPRLRMRKPFLDPRDEASKD
jgi:hypothetical protein